MLVSLNDCGCCEGVTAIVPRSRQNRPGLPRVSYRLGRHNDFLRSALAALSDPDLGGLHGLTTREANDFTIALLDGWATLADVFTFYQERIANESWLRTASERDSILRLAQLIGYRLKGGVAAETPLAFLLDETPGAPRAVTVEIGTKVQSIPGAGEKAQTFETIEPLRARVEWNAMRPLAIAAPTINSATTSLWLKGTATNLQAGDAILIVGSEREGSGTASPNKNMWGLRVLLTVTVDNKNDRTLVTWKTGLSNPPVQNVKVFAMRQRAAIFGHNAPDPALITKPDGTAVGTWPGFDDELSPIELDNAYPKVIADSWVVLAEDRFFVIAAATGGLLVPVSMTPGRNLYRASKVSFPSRAAFGLSAKVTRITPDTTELLNHFNRRETVVYAQSEQLEMTNGPLLTPPAGSLIAGLTRNPDLLAPIEGSIIPLSARVPKIEAGRKVVISGKLLRVRVAAASLTVVSLDGLQSRSVSRGASLLLRQAPSSLAFNFVRWPVRTSDGFDGVIVTSRTNLVLAAAEKEDALVSEVAVVRECAGDPSVLTLENPPLARLYDRATVTISANVADATHGETVTEVLGSGDASQAHQRFKLKQLPLTRTRSTAPGGAASSLQIRVNDLLWLEAPTLFGRGPSDRVFTTDLADDGSVAVRFGDGIRGARVPSGPQNIKATYRRGVGLAGLVRANQLSTLLTRPPGLQAAINPLAAEGADDPESFANARQNAPRTVLTLDRVVSLQDYESFSRAYAGIAKARATWTWDGRTPGVFITVAGPNGAAISAPLRDELVTAIHAAGDPFVPVRIASYVRATFRVSAQIATAPEYEPANVRVAAEQTLRKVFAFEPRDFGQPVFLSEVIALLQSVPGVSAVNVKKLHRTGATPRRNARLEANLPHGGDLQSLGAAELLTIDPAPLELIS